MKNILHCLAFYARYQGLHSFDKSNRATVSAIKSLEKKGYLLVSWETSQACFIQIAN